MADWRGQGLLATWPVQLPPLRIPIDHALGSAGCGSRRCVAVRPSQRSFSCDCRFFRLILWQVV
jgi:hypothetical protein